MTGELQGPAQTPRQIQKITVTIEQLPDKRWRISMPDKAPGWSEAASRPPDVIAALRRAFTEAQVAAFSDWRGHLYDMPDSAEHRRHKPRARSKKRCDVYDVCAWLLREDGKWVSPGARGMAYPEHTQVVQRVMAQRRAMGLPSRPDPVSAIYLRAPVRRVHAQRDWSGAVTSVEFGAPVRLVRPRQESA